MKNRTVIFCFLVLLALGWPSIQNMTIPSHTSVAQERDVWPSDLIAELEPVLSGFTEPLYLTSARDGTGRLFIAERAGRIKVVQPGQDLQPAIFLDITSRVLKDDIGGFVGLAFHPGFRTNGRFFVCYTRISDGALAVSEYHVSASNPNVAETDETVLLAINRQLGAHNGGMLEFGPDGYLYIGVGDGSPSRDPGNFAQNIESLLGKILRIDVDNPDGNQPYSSPPDNPFFGPTPGRDEIFALGVRNPYRFSFDRETGHLYCGDVGERMKEEVSFIRIGGNYGWRIMEGTFCSGLDPQLCDTIESIPPIVQYGHAGRVCAAVTGGYVYRGRRDTLPVSTYVFGDFCTGEIFVLNEGVFQLLLDTELNISSFGEDEEGEIYVVDIAGTIHRIVNPNPVTPPEEADPPVVEVLTPNTRIKVKAGKVYDITWSSTGEGLDRHDIQLSLDNGSTWQDVVTGLPGTARSYAWTVPDTKAKNALIRVIAYGSSTSTGEDQSDSTFKIKRRKNT